MTNEGRISRGWRLTRTAWGVLRHDRTALVLTAMQALAVTVIVVAMLILSGWIHQPGQGSRLLLAAVVAYLPSTFINTYLGVALCAAVAAAMSGERLGLAQALAVPRRRLRQIVLWSLLAAGVGLLIELVVERLPFGGRILAWLAGMAWSIGTLFVLPILALDDGTTEQCVRRSVALVKRRWGEGVTGNLVIGAWAVVVAIPLLVVALSFVHLDARPQPGAMVIYMIGMAIVGTVTLAATRVFSVALYRYAIDADAAGPFADADLREPFRRRRGRH